MYCVIVVYESLTHQSTTFTLLHLFLQNVVTSTCLRILLSDQRQSQLSSINTSSRTTATSTSTSRSLIKCTMFSIYKSMDSLHSILLLKLSHQFRQICINSVTVARHATTLAQRQHVRTGEGRIVETRTQAASVGEPGTPHIIAQGHMSSLPPSPRAPLPTTLVHPPIPATTRS